VARAANEGTTTAGGFGVPVMIDPTIIITSGAADAPILRICRTEPVTNNVWKGVSSAGMTWSYDAEAAEVSDDMATLAQPSVTVYMPRGYIPYSIEVGMDYPGFASRCPSSSTRATPTCSRRRPSSVRRHHVAARDLHRARREHQRRGRHHHGRLVRRRRHLQGLERVPERYRSRATWVMSVSTSSRRSAVRGVGGGSSSSYFTVDLTADGTVEDQRRPVIVTDYAPSYTSATVPGTTGAANILVVGDFSNYLIAQRAGMSVEQVPMMIGSSQRPDRPARHVRLGP
jgi:predicted phage gp36 major capsid-like protein